MTTVGFQFAHIEGYARVGAVQKVKNKKTGEVSEQRTRSMQDIVAEAEREAGNCPHVQNPETPELLFGVMPSEVMPMATAWAEQAKDAQGRKLRKDGQCLLAGVMSLPRDRENEFDEFAQACIAWLKEQYGARLKSVIAHRNDEEHPHIHFYVVPEFGEAFEAVHDGVKASKEAKAQGKLKGEQNHAYNYAMRAWQDRYFMGVGMRFGLARIGPGRRRLSRAAWVAEQAANHANALALKAAEAAAAETAAAAAETIARVDRYEQAAVERVNGMVSSIINKAKAEAHRVIEAAKAEALQLVGNAEAKVEKIRANGARVGSWFASAMGVYHKPTAKAFKEAEAHKKARLAAEADAKKDADERVTKIANELQDIKAKNKGLDKEIGRLQDANTDLHTVADWYEKKYGPPPPHLPKIK